MKSFLPKMNFYIFVILKHIIIIQIITPYFSVSECDYHTPIRNTINNECIIGECLISDFENNICIIDNQIVKTQWINNFIIREDYDYIDFCLSLNGDLISLITTYQTTSPSRIFFHIEGENGRGYFSNSDEDIPFFEFTYNGEGREHLSVFILKLYNNSGNQEYIMSISANNEYVELYDFDKDIVYTCGSEGAFQVEYIWSYISSFIELGNNYYSLVFIGKTYNNYYFCINKLLLTDKDIYYSSKFLLPDYSKQIKCSDAKIVSCFISVKNYIICFYQDISKNYVEIIYDIDINEQNNDTIVEGLLETDKFFKGVHFTEEAGAFIYYDNSNRPNVLFKKYENSNITNYFNSLERIILKIGNLNMDVELNDLIKISDLKICFTSLSEDKKDLYLIIINNYDTTYEKIKIKYYLIHMHNLYLFNFNNKIKTIIYNEYLVFGTSYANKYDDNFPGTSIIMFSYPNSEDLYFDITGRLRILKILY